MADLLQLRGLIAAEPSPIGLDPAAGARAARQTGAVTGESSAAGPAVHADEVEVRPAMPVDLRTREMDSRQQAIAANAARAEALGIVRDRLIAVREGRQDALETLRNDVEGMRDLVSPGENLAKLLVRVEPRSAEALAPGLVETALVETENALAALYGVLENDRRGLFMEQVAVENENASRVEAERLERAAELLHRREAEGEPTGLLDALRGPAIDRQRVIQLLTPGA